jgi:DNA-binding NtrC family response regulator
LTAVHGVSAGRRGIRLIAGTRYDLALSSRTGAFDRELYRRLSEGEIKIPPLRERPSDILLLADHFLTRLAMHRPGNAPRLTAAAKELLVSYTWPGNVRELLGVLQIALLKANGRGELDVEHFAECLQPSRPQAAPRRAVASTTAPTGRPAPSPAPATSASMPVDASLHFVDGRIAIELPPEGIAFDDFEKAILRAALARTRGNVLRAAKLLHLGRGSLRYRLEKHGIVQPRRRRAARRRPEKGAAELGSQEPLPRAS